MLRPLTIGIRGLAGAGKTTVALGVTAALVNAEKHSMAGPIRSGLETMGITKETQPDLYRRLAQEIGGSARAIDKDHWVKLFKQRNLRTQERGRHSILDDVRYPNEGDICDLIFFLKPVGFHPLDLKERGDHESEQWNREFDPSNPPPNTLLVENHFGNVELTISLIRERILLEWHVLHEVIPDEKFETKLLMKGPK